MEEVWKTVVEDYEISNYGNCRKNNIIIKGSIQNSGYRYFQLQREGKRINYLFHHLVAKAFLGERPQDLVIDHIDQNKLNNNINNLRYTTQKENCKNQKRYRTDIESTDLKERKKIFQKEFDIKRGHSKGINRPKGSGSIQKRNNKFRAITSLNKIKYSKTFNTIEEAEIYLKQINSNANV